MERSQQVKWGLKWLYTVLVEKGKGEEFSSIIFEKKRICLANRIEAESYSVRKKGRSLMVRALSPKGALYALIDIAERIRYHLDFPEYFEDGPCLKYRGYTLGFQRPTGFYRDHKYYDWPISKKNFPWFHDQNHMLSVLNRLVSQRCNMLILWSSHPFASFLKLPNYPEMLEVTEEELRRNEKQLKWLEIEAKKRGIQLFFHFYNIHMPDPLAKAKGWNVLSQVPTEEIAEYTRQVIQAFAKRYPSCGLVACIGEVLKKEYKLTWLKDVILKSVPAKTPLVIRAHQFDIEKHLREIKKSHIDVMTMHKHNDENLHSPQTAFKNTKIAKKSNNHIISVHHAANLEPFSWGSPAFIQNTCDQMIRQGANGVNVYPLRFWDWPNSAHCHSSSNQLYEHFVWWTAWGRYLWNPKREKKSEKHYWTLALSEHYSLKPKDAKRFLLALEDTATTLPNMSSQFLISSGNRQNISLGLFLIPFAFTRSKYQNYSMSQVIGFPLIGEELWSTSPIELMQTEFVKCLKALKQVDNLLLKYPEHAFLHFFRDEVHVLLLLTQFYQTKSQACAEYFHLLFGIKTAKEECALALLEKSVFIYSLIERKTRSLFKDASSLHTHRTIPLPADKGYLHWKDCLPVFEEELAIAKSLGIRKLLHWKPAEMSRLIQKKHIL